MFFSLIPFHVLIIYTTFFFELRCHLDITNRPSHMPFRNDTNVVLADEMGPGKTVQSVSMLGFLQNAQEIHGPFLVVVPLSTLSNWAKEFRKWLPEMNVIVYVGARASREVCQQYEFYSNKKNGRGIKFDGLLTTYEVLLKDKGVISRLKWNYLMVDEAHRIKNIESSLYITLSEFSTKNKLLITGTPLQNSAEELWARLHFLDPNNFLGKEEFVQNYKNSSSFNENELATLHMELRPHILRRVREDVEKSLPPKIERVLRDDPVALDMVQLLVQVPAFDLEEKVILWERGVVMDCPNSVGPLNFKRSRPKISPKSIRVWRLKEGKLEELWYRKYCVLSFVLSRREMSSRKGSNPVFISQNLSLRSGICL